MERTGLPSSGKFFCRESRGLLSLVMSLYRRTEIPEGDRSQPYEQGPFFEVLEQEELEAIELPGGIRSQLKVPEKIPSW